MQEASKDIIDLLNYKESTNYKSEQYTAVVVEVLKSNKRAKIKLFGNDTIFDFINKTGEKLSVGDSIYIKTNNGSLTGGYISQRFGEPVWASNTDAVRVASPMTASPQALEYHQYVNQNIAAPFILSVNIPYINGYKMGNIEVLIAVNSDYYRAQYNTDFIYYYSSDKKLNIKFLKSGGYIVNYSFSLQ